MYTIKSGSVEIQAPHLAEVLGIVNDREFHELDLGGLTVALADSEVPLIKNGSGKLGVAIGGEHDEALMSLLSPILPYFVRDGKALLPWQMPRTQWMAFVAIGSVAYEVLPGLDHTLPRRNYSCAFNGIPQLVSLTSWLEQTLREALGYGHNGPEFKRGHGGINSRHETHVAHALANNLPVAPGVIADMLRSLGTNPIDLSFAPAVAERPFLRGRLNVDQLDTLLTVYERHGKQQITKENVDQLFSIARAQGEDPNYTTMDDALYAAGHLPPLPTMVRRVIETQPIQPSGPKAQALLSLLNEMQSAAAISSLVTKRHKGEISQRRFEQEHAFLVGGAFDSTSASHANRVVAAMESKDLPFLLDLLDCPDERNGVSKRFVREHYSLNVLNLKAGERRSALFRYCGLDASQQTAWEVAYAEKRRASIAAKDAAYALESAISMASSYKVRDETGTVSTWKELIDRRIAGGFTDMTTHRQGAILKHYMINRTTSAMMPVQRKDGSLAYAQLAVADHQAAAAATAIQVDVEDEPRVREAHRG